LEDEKPEKHTEEKDLDEDPEACLHPQVVVGQPVVDDPHPPQLLVPLMRLERPRPMVIMLKYYF
jgi:hypothetical protein